MVATSGGGGGGGGGGEERGGRNASEREKTKLRERKRRAITTNIFNGLRKHGGYHLAPRADINDVLRELAREAGWVVELDGTTYRSHHQLQQVPSHPLHFLQQCPACGFSMPATARVCPTPTPSGSLCGGDCSTTASPRGVPVVHQQLTCSPPATPFLLGSNLAGGSPAVAVASPSLPLSADGGAAAFMWNGRSTGVDMAALESYMGLVEGGHRGRGVGGAGKAASLMMMTTQMQQEQHAAEQEAMGASNHNTPVGSPQGQEYSS